eukprot:s183_g7.t1
MLVGQKQTDEAERVVDQRGLVSGGRAEEEGAAGTSGTGRSKGSDEGGAGGGVIEGAGKAACAACWRDSLQAAAICEATSVASRGDAVECVGAGATGGGEGVDGYGSGRRVCGMLEGKLDVPWGIVGATPSVPDDDADVPLTSQNTKDEEWADQVRMHLADPTRRKAPCELQAADRPILATTTKKSAREAFASAAKAPCSTIPLSKVNTLIDVLGAANILRG